MLTEKMTYQKFMLEFHPKIRALFDQHGIGLDRDIAPFWEMFKANTLLFYESKMSLEDGKHYVLDIKSEMMFNIRWSIEHEVKNPIFSISRNYESLRRRIETKLLENFTLLQKDQDLNALLESFIREHQKHFLQHDMAEAIQSWGRRGYITTKWQKKGDNVGGYLAHVEAEKAIKIFEKRIMDKIDEVVKYLKQTGGTSPIPSVVSPSMPIQELHQQRAILLRTLQTIG